MTWLVVLPFGNETGAKNALAKNGEALGYGGKVIEDQVSFYLSDGILSQLTPPDEQNYRAAYALSYLTQDGQTLVKIGVAMGDDEAKSAAIAWTKENNGTPREITVMSERGIYTLRNFR